MIYLARTVSNVSNVILQTIKKKKKKKKKSRVSLRTVMKSLKRRKLRKKHKLLIKNSVPVSSVLYSIATHYKQWHITHTNRQDSFYSSYSMRTTTAYTCNVRHVSFTIRGY